MAYSFIAITQKETDWKNLHADISGLDEAIELFPIEPGEKNETCLGICIASSKLKTSPDLWKNMVRLAEVLEKKYGFRIFDLYNGIFLEESNYEQVKKSLFS